MFKVVFIKALLYSVFQDMFTNRCLKVICLNSIYIYIVLNPSHTLYGRSPTSGIFD